jgi:hypothetical protein
VFSKNRCEPPQVSFGTPLRGFEEAEKKTKRSLSKVWLQKMKKSELKSAWMEIIYIIF